MSRTSRRLARSVSPAARHGRQSATGPILSISGVCAGMVALTLLAYWPLLSTTTGLLWDDSGHLTRPALRSLDGLWRIWFDIGTTQQYYPVLHTAFWLQAHVWGDTLTGYHVVNIALHAGSACLLLLALRRLRVPGALLAGVLFAIHPVQVESVAWISELKNTLSGAFFFAAGLTYLRFDETRSPVHYAASLALYALAVLSKSVTATLPVGLLVVLWWRRGTPAWTGARALDGRRDLLPLAPFVLVGALAGALTVWFEYAVIGAEGDEFAFNVLERTLIAGRAIWFYLATLAWPAHLSFNYPRWAIDAGAIGQYLYPLGVLVGFGMLWRGGWRGTLAAMLFFCVTVAPALGFVNVYPFRFSFVADHFQYHASAGPLALAASFLVGVAGRVRLPQAGVRLLAAALTFVLGATTASYARHYVNAPALYRATIAANPASWLAHNNLGALLIQGSMAELHQAVPHLREAVRLKPDYAEARFNLGVALQRLGDCAGATAEYRAVLAALGDDSGRASRRATTHARLGTCLRVLGRREEALPELKRAIELDPDSPTIHAELGVALAEAGRADEGLRYLRDAVRLRPGEARYWINLGSALVYAGRPDEARQAFLEAIRLDPVAADAHHNLGSLYLTLGRFADAAASLREALRLQPGDPGTERALALALAGLRSSR